MLKPKPFSLKDMDGGDVDVILTRMPATVGVDISVKVPMGMLPKIGDLGIFKDTRQEIMRYVYVPSKTEGAQDIQLKTEELVNAHIPDAETLLKILMAMMEYNFSFFGKGKISDFLGEMVNTVVGKIIEMSTQSSAPSSPPAAQPTTSSAPSTT